MIRSLFLAAALLSGSGGDLPSRGILVRVGDTPDTLAAEALVRPEAWNEVEEENSLLNPGTVLWVPLPLLRPRGQPVVLRCLGAPRVRPRGQRNWVPVREGLLLEAGDVVETPLGSSLELKYPAGNRISVRQLSRCVCLSPEEKAAAAIGVARGRVVCSAGAGENRTGDAMVVIAPGLEVLSHNAEFRVKAGPSGRSQVEVLRGEVEASCSGTGQTVGAGQGLFSSTATPSAGRGGFE
ncbi:MAG TPA: FecR domain-containing protein [bacterium]|nr:FecR domain-containing protein [bacterium]HPQ67428.1 FecR domain-containing protein [bacterium]